ELLRRPGCWRQPYHSIPIDLCPFANHSQSRGLAGAGHTIECDNLFPREENVVYRLELRAIQFRVTVFGGNSNLGRNQHRIGVTALVALQHLSNDFALQAYHRCGSVLPAGADVRHFAELSGLNPAIELLPNSGESGFTHTTR